MSQLSRLALSGAILLAGMGLAHAQVIPAQYPPPPAYGQPGYGPPPGYAPPGYPQPGYPPQPGYYPPPRPDYEPERPRGMRCEATLYTPRGPRTIICPLEEPRSLGRRCECPPPPPPPGYPPLAPPEGRVIR